MIYRVMLRSPKQVNYLPILAYRNPARAIYELLRVRYLLGKFGYSSKLVRY